MYIKLFRSILSSTIWLEDDHVLRCWLAMLLMSESDGLIKISIPGLAKEASITIDQCREALAKLESPDPDSQSQEEGGRRIIRISQSEPIWLIVNYEKYRKLRDSDQRREYMKEYMREYRASLKTVNPVNTGKPQLAHEEEELELELLESPMETPARSQEPDSEPVLSFPVVGKPKEWILTAAKLEEYVETYPALDHMAEARTARQWCIDNPTKRKTAKGMTKFLNGWMDRSQNDSKKRQGGSSGIAAKPADKGTGFHPGDYEQHRDAPRWPEYEEHVLSMASGAAAPFTEWEKTNADT